MWRVITTFQGEPVVFELGTIEEAFQKGLAELKEFEDMWRTSIDETTENLDLIQKKTFQECCLELQIQSKTILWQIYLDGLDWPEVYCEIESIGWEA